MIRRILPRLLTAAATLTALVAAVTLFATTGFAGSSSATADNYAPVSKEAPAIEGTAEVGKTLTATTGTWVYQSTPTFTFQWLRCDSKGDNCAQLKSSTKNTYDVGSDDVGDTLRVLVTAQNKEGTTTANSAPTAVVTKAAPATPPPPSGPAGAIKLPNGKTSIPASSVQLPARLVIDGVQYQPRTVQGHGPVQARFHVSDTRGYVVRDALVYALGIPYAWVRGGNEVRTDQEGWATLEIDPSFRMPRRRGALMVFVRARVEGQDLLAGTSSRRLSQILIR
jgi:hypothetical protein